MKVVLGWVRLYALVLNHHIPGSDSRVITDAEKQETRRGETGNTQGEGEFIGRVCRDVFP